MSNSDEKRSGINSSQMHMATLIVAILSLLFGDIIVPVLLSVLFGSGVPIANIQTKPENPPVFQKNQAAENCGIYIIVTTGEGNDLNQIRILPRNDAPNSSPAIQGTKVVVEAEADSGWMRITYFNNGEQHKGYIESRYLENFGECPQSEFKVFGLGRIT